MQGHKLNKLIGKQITNYKKLNASNYSAILGIYLKSFTHLTSIFFWYMANTLHITILFPEYCRSFNFTSVWLLATQAFNEETDHLQASKSYIQGRLNQFYSTEI